MTFAALRVMPAPLVDDGAKGSATNPEASSRCLGGQGNNVGRIRRRTCHRLMEPAFRGCVSELAGKSSPSAFTVGVFHPAAATRTSVPATGRLEAQSKTMLCISRLSFPVMQFLAMPLHLIIRGRAVLACACGPFFHRLRSAYTAILTVRSALQFHDGCEGGSALADDRQSSNFGLPVVAAAERYMLMITKARRRRLSGNLHW